MYKYNEMPLRELPLDDGRVEKIPPCTLTIPMVKEFGAEAKPIEEFEEFAKYDVEDGMLTVYQFRLVEPHGYYIVTIEIGSTQGKVCVGREYGDFHGHVLLPTDGSKDIAVAIMRTLASLLEYEKELREGNEDGHKREKKGV
ncbi:hypothetical protein [Bacillus thuringiensis]|uniref:hypothetical protein n=1 Tax=Bacillus thuringiensis TaxID=1428 RepID=UPI000BFDF6C8|nr:hypothetical protein [Bacillus thuringiensis]PGT89910.1 hypothetical protein COD17_09170 [Bacillus thuringiensis]